MERSLSRNSTRKMYAFAAVYALLLWLEGCVQLLHYKMVFEKVSGSAPRLIIIAGNNLEKINHFLTYALLFAFGIYILKSLPKIRTVAVTLLIGLVAPLIGLYALSYNQFLVQLGFERIVFNGVRNCWGVLTPIFDNAYWGSIILLPIILSIYGLKLLLSAKSAVLSKPAKSIRGPTLAICCTCVGFVLLQAFYMAVPKLQEGGIIGLLPGRYILEPLYGLSGLPGLVIPLFFLFLTLRILDGRLSLSFGVITAICLIAMSSIVSLSFGNVIVFKMYLRASLTFILPASCFVIGHRLKL